MCYLTAQIYMQKASLIAERELHMTEDEQNNTKLFPSFIILRRPADDSNEDESAEMQGFINDLKLQVKTDTQRMLTQTAVHNDNLTGAMTELKDMREKMDEVKEKITVIDQKLEEIMKTFKKE